MNQPTYTPTGTEAQVCEDIARRQQLGVHKYGRTVADNPLALKAWMQHLYEELLDAAVYVKRAMAELPTIMAKPAPAVSVAHTSPTPAKPKLPPTGRFVWQGQPASVTDLAKLAGCNYAAMKARLARHSVEVAVAMGPAGQQGVKRGHDPSAPTAARMAKAKRWPYKGQMLQARELAAICGVTPHLMHLRLRSHSAEEAVAMGQPAPKKPKAPKSARLSTPKNLPTMPLKRIQTFAADAKVIVPPNVKVTQAPAPQDRFAITSAPQHFSGRPPGHYDADAAETPLARAGVARGAA